MNQPNPPIIKMTVDHMKHSIVQALINYESDLNQQIIEAVDQG